MSRPPELLQGMGLQKDFRGRCRRMDDIHRIAEDPDWTAVKKRVTSHPEEAEVAIWVRALNSNKLLVPTPELLKERDNKPVFALHVALYTGTWPVPIDVPADVLRALLAANPAAATPTMLEEVCKDRNLSGNCIEAILDHGHPSLSSTESLKSSLCAAIRSDGLGICRSPSDERLEAARVLIRRYFSADDSVGHFPIYYACNKIDSVSWEMFELIIEEGMNQNIGGQHGAGGLFMEVTSRNHEISNWDSGSDGKAEEKEGKHKTILDLALHRFDTTDPSAMDWNDWEPPWEAMDMCLRAAATANVRQENWLEYPSLHAAILFGTISVIDMAVEVMIEVTGGKPLETFTEKDCLGRSPMNLALENMCRFEHAQDRAKILRLLLANDSERMTSCDNDCFIKVAATVDNGQALYECAAECDANAKVLRSVLRAHPTLFGYQDSTTSLHPWMLLASRPDSMVTDIFDLLRQNPSSVEGGIKPSAQESYRAKKATEKEIWWKQEYAKLKRERDTFADEITHLKAKIRKLESSRCDS